MLTSNHWHILGPGAIGLLWASYWCQDNVNVTLIGTQKSQTVPLCNTTTGATSEVDYLNFTAITGPIHKLLVTTKAYDTQTAYQHIQEYLADDAIIVVLQNGLEANTLSIRKEQSLIAATTTDGAYRQQAFQVVHAGKGETLLGVIKGHCDTELLIPHLPCALNIKTSADINQALWRKFAINCAINGLTVKYDCKNGELLSNPNAESDLRALCKEISAVANQQMSNSSFDELYSEVEQVLLVTADNINSMLQDINANKKTEIDQLNGKICSQAQTLKLDCSSNTALIELIHKREAHG